MKWSLSGAEKPGRRAGGQAESRRRSRSNVRWIGLESTPNKTGQPKTREENGRSKEVRPKACANSCGAANRATKIQRDRATREQLVHSPSQKQKHPFRAPHEAASGVRSARLLGPTQGSAVMPPGQLDAEAPCAAGTRGFSCPSAFARRNEHETLALFSLPRATESSWDKGCRRSATSSHSRGSPRTQSQRIVRHPGEPNPPHCPSPRSRAVPAIRHVLRALDSCCRGARTSARTIAGHERNSFPGRQRLFFRNTRS